MLERVQDAPAQTLALRASGTVMARGCRGGDRGGAGSIEAATGLVMIIAPDFDGYFAELARGLASAALAHKSLVKLARRDATPSGWSDARGSDFEASPVPIRLVPASRRLRKGASDRFSMGYRGRAPARESRQRQATVDSIFRNVLVRASGQRPRDRHHAAGDKGGRWRDEPGCGLRDLLGSADAAQRGHPLDALAESRLGQAGRASCRLR